VALETLQTRAGHPVTEPPPDLARLFHRLNNQLGVILANAELLEARLTDETQRARASHVVAGALDAMSAIQELRRHLDVANGTEK
jgi:two-component sensor histidine kinase